MLRFDPTTTSGSAVAALFRTWCSMRDADSTGGLGGSPLAEAVEEAFVDLGLDLAAPASQVDVPVGQVFTVFGLRYDRADALLVAGVLPGEHAASVVELSTDETNFSRWSDTFTAASADAAASAARAQVEQGEDGPTAEDF